MKSRILIVEDNVTLSQMQKEWLTREGYEVTTAMDAAVARRHIRKTCFDLILSDVRLPEGDGLSLLAWLRKERQDIPFIIMTEYASYPDAVKAIKMGAKDYLPKPVHRERLLELVKELAHPVFTIQHSAEDMFRRTSPKAREAVRLAELVAPTDISALIFGANGTGKESIARSIHFNSHRKDGPFVAVNCGAIPPELIASMFFGHVKGAFTGADTDRKGYFDAAKGGTLFLDEIGTLPYHAQSSLLRVLQESVYMPVGSNAERRADVRIVSATNEDMERAIADGRFREDLYHRLCEFEIHQPSLAESTEDILPLAEFFRKKYSKELRKETTGFSTDAEMLMLGHSWSGNIRELQNRVRRAVLISKTPVIGSCDMSIMQKPDMGAPGSKLVLRPIKDDEGEKQLILRTLESCGGNKSKAARLLNIDSSTLYRKMDKYGLR